MVDKYETEIITSQLQPFFHIFLQSTFVILRFWSGFLVSFSIKIKPQLTFVKLQTSQKNAGTEKKAYSTDKMKYF